MSNWIVEVHLQDMCSKWHKVVKPDEGVDASMVLQLAQVEARFDYEGYRFYGSRPYVDPLARKLIYYCEGSKIYEG